MKKAILFDMDGVLVDSEPFYFKRKMDFLTEQKISITMEELHVYIGRNMIDILCDKVPSAIIRKELQASYVLYTEMHPINYASVIRPYLIETLEKLSSLGYACALVSSSPSRIIKKAITECAIDSYFQCIISGDDVTHCKPDPQAYVFAMKKLHVMPEECLIIEDSQVGICAGKRAGAYVLALRDQFFNINQANCDAQIDSLKEIFLYL